MKKSLLVLLCIFFCMIAASLTASAEMKVSNDLRVSVVNDPFVNDNCKLAVELRETYGGAFDAFYITDHDINILTLDGWIDPDPRDKSSILFVYTVRSIPKGESVGEMFNLALISRYAINDEIKVRVRLIGRAKSSNREENICSEYCYLTVSKPTFDPEKDVAVDFSIEEKSIVATPGKMLHCTAEITNNSEFASFFPISLNIYSRKNPDKRLKSVELDPTYEIPMGIHFEKSFTVTLTDEMCGEDTADLFCTFSYLTTGKSARRVWSFGIERLDSKSAECGVKLTKAVLDTRVCIGVSNCQTSPELISDKALGEIGFSEASTHTNVSALWYENGVTVTSLYGENGWKKEKLKGSTMYYAVVRVTPKPGYEFPDISKIYLTFQTRKVENLRMVGDTIIFTTPIMYTPCQHSFSGWTVDGQYHYRTCTLCGREYDRGEHTWDSGTRKNNGDIEYKCSVCKKATRTEVTEDKAIKEVYYELGNVFAGHTCTLNFSKSNYGISQHTEKLYIKVNGAIRDAGTNSEFVKDKPYRLVVQLIAQNGYYLDPNIEVFIRMNGNKYYATRSSDDSDVCSFSFEFTPADPPEVKIVLPDKIKPGADIVKLVSDCDVFVNGSRQGTYVSFVTVGDKYYFIRLYDLWMGGTNLETYLKSVDAKDRDRVSQDLTAEEGKNYIIVIYAINNGNSKPNRTYPEKITVQGASKAVSVSKLDSYMGVTASFAVSKPEPQVIELTDKMPKFGEKPTNLNTARLKSKWDTSKITCEKPNKVTYTVYATEADEFSVAPIVIFNNSGINDYKISSDGKMLSFTVNYTVDHKEKTETVPATCNENGSTAVICTQCGQTLANGVLPAMGHHTEKMDATEGDCTNESTGEYWLCLFCGGLFEDETGLKALSEIPTGEKNPSNHVGGQIEYDENCLWTKCQCGEELEKEAHSFDENGTCTVCGYEKGNEPTSENTDTKPDDTKPDDTKPSEGTNTLETSDRGGKERKSSLLWLWILLSVIVVAATVFFVIYKNNNEKNNEK